MQNAQSAGFQVACIQLWPVGKHWGKMASKRLQSKQGLLLDVDVNGRGYSKPIHMHDVIKKLTPEQALAVLMRLSDKESGIRDAALAEVCHESGKSMGIELQ
jgi:hypothetical protein